jgi:hypothetical protein
MNEPDMISREELVEQLRQQHEHVFDPATAPEILHNWIDRGMKYSCEYAGHSNHEVWKRVVPIKQ